MIKNHQTTIGILEKGRQELNGTRIELLGPESLLEETKYSTLNVEEAKTIAETHAVGTYIIYTVQQNTETDVISVEKGIGQIEKEGNTHYINRLLPISRGKSANTLFPATQIADFEETRDTFLVIGTSAPSNIAELLFLPNSIASTNNEGVQTTPIPQNCLIGRVEGDIEGLQDVSITSLRLAPSSVPTDPENGTIILNEDTRKLQVFIDGSWGPL